MRHKVIITQYTWHTLKLYLVKIYNLILHKFNVSKVDYSSYFHRIAKIFDVALSKLNFSQIKVLSELKIYPPNG